MAASCSSSSSSGDDSIRLRRPPRALPTRLLLDRRCAFCTTTIALGSMRFTFTCCHIRFHSHCIPYLIHYLRERRYCGSCGAECTRAEMVGPHDGYRDTSSSGHEDYELPAGSHGGDLDLDLEASVSSSSLSSSTSDDSRRLWGPPRPHPTLLPARRCAFCTSTIAPGSLRFTFRCCHSHYHTRCISYLIHYLSERRYCGSCGAHCTPAEMVGPHNGYTDNSDSDEEEHEILLLLSDDDSGSSSSGEEAHQIL